MSQELKMNHQKKQKKQKHKYTSELELKSLLIRIKNTREDKGTEKLNTRINKYIKWHTALGAKKYDSPTKRKLLKAKLKLKIIELSVLTRSDSVSYERFGTVILLMIKNILKKSQFSGYTYKDDFYSDAVYKILKYLHNFKHEMISEITGVAVNAFAYISQIIHNSVLFIINTKKKDLMNLRKQMAMQYLSHPNQYPADLHVWDDRGADEITLDNEEITENVIIHSVDTDLVSLIDAIQKLRIDLGNETKILNVYYPSDYVITVEEYNQLRPVLRGSINIMRSEPLSLPQNLTETET
jgi:hypothetical protein